LTFFSFYLASKAVCLPNIFENAAKPVTF